MGSVSSFSLNQPRGLNSLAIGIFGKKKTEDAPSPSPEPVVLSRLQELTGTDTEMYQALSRLLFLDPKKIMTTLEEAVSQATAFESSSSKTRAEVWYRIAGGISLFKGDADAVRKFFEKALAFAGNAKPEYKTTASRSQDAVALAKKYYEIL
jgi:hypothetical protein